MEKSQINQAFENSKVRYAELGNADEEAVKQLDKFSNSLHCWQTDDVTRFEKGDGVLTGGILL
jgi:L-rhamnose isomerase